MGPFLGRLPAAAVRNKQGRAQSRGSREGGRGEQESYCARGGGAPAAPLPLERHPPPPRPAARPAPPPPPAPGPAWLSGCRRGRPHSEPEPEPPPPRALGRPPGHQSGPPGHRRRSGSGCQGRSGQQRRARACGRRGSPRGAGPRRDPR